MFQIKNHILYSYILYIIPDTYKEKYTYLATAVKASSTLRPDLALVSMKGTPNSCRAKAMNLNAKCFFCALCDVCTKT